MRRILLLLLVCGCVSLPTGRIRHKTVTWFEVEKVIDGVTIRIKGVGRVRFRGVIVPREGIIKAGRIAEEAEAFTEELLKGRLVRCEPDVPGVVPKGTVYVADVFVRMSDTEQVLASEELLRVGLAFLSADYRRSAYAERLKSAEEEAKRRSLGIWHKE